MSKTIDLQSIKQRYGGFSVEYKGPLTKELADAFAAITLLLDRVRRLEEFIIPPAPVECYCESECGECFKRREALKIERF